MREFSTLFSLLFLSIVVNAQLKNVRSELRTFDVTTGEEKVVFTENTHFEAPNWTNDGKFFVINSYGKLYKITVDGREKTVIETGFADMINNDHGFTPDGKTLIISHNDEIISPNSEERSRSSRIYTMPAAGGIPKPITQKTPSYWHDVSPNGETLVYVGMRNDEYDIYSISINGGEERKLTTTKGLEDGPDYSPDGKYVYYNAITSGKMEIWRMDADGKNPVQLTDNDYSNWFPHPSPDGKQLVFLSFLEQQGSGHPAMKEVALHLYNLKTKEVRELTRFIGGQGSINVPSWSPDGTKFAFVAYSYID